MLNIVVSGAITVCLVAIIAMKINALMYTTNEWVTSRCPSSLLWPYLLASMIIYRPKLDTSSVSELVVVGAISLCMLWWGWTEMIRPCVNDDITQELVLSRFFRRPYSFRNIKTRTWTRSWFRRFRWQ